jgi:transposase-like protein
MACSMAPDLSDPIFTDEEAARSHLEAQRWPDGPVCPRCGSLDGISKLQGKAHRPGLYYCKGCKAQFTVTVGTVYERSHIPLNKWVLAMHLLCASKKGMSGHQLHRMLGVSYKTAWFMAHRLREAMRDETPTEGGGSGGLGGEGKTVEADETFLGSKDGAPKKGVRGTHTKRAILSLVERGGHVRSFHIRDLTKATIGDIVRRNVYRESRLMTDEAKHYTMLGKEFASHGTTEHNAGIYVDRNDRSIHTNTIEGFFSIFKRGMKGIYQHCGEQHLHRYLAEFDFRYNTRAALGISDSQRRDLALANIGGRRLTYR